MAVVNKVACKSSHDLLAIIYISGNVGGYASSNLGWQNDIFIIAICQWSSTLKLSKNGYTYTSYIDGISGVLGTLKIIYPC